MGVMNVFTLLGGLGLFLFGMKIMGEGLEKAAGTRLKKLLEYVTNNRVLAVLVGFLVTAVIQSSSATTVMVVGFVNASLLTLSQAVGIIMGANIGTTVTSLMLSIKLDFGAIFACIGLVLIFFPKKEVLKQTGQIMMGLGILFMGMNTMSQAMEPLRSWEGFTNMMQSISNPFLGVLVGALVTAVIQSSSASVGILQALAGQGLMPFQTALFILFGQNIGTCITAMLASAGTSHTAKRTALVHLLFNVMGTAIFIAIALLLPFSEWIQSMAPDNIRLQIAITHVIFNVTTTVILLPMASVLEKAAWLIERGEDPVREPMSLQYFDPRLLNTPSIAAAQLFLEVKRMAQMTLKNFHNAIACYGKYDKDLAAEIASNEDVIDYLNQEITSCLVDVKATELPHKDFRMVGSLFHVINDLERVADHSVNMMEGAAFKDKEDIAFSHKAQSGLEELIGVVDNMLILAIDIFENQSTERALIDSIEEMEEKVDALTEELRDGHMERLKNKKCNVKNGMNYLALLSDLERVADHAENIATSVE